MKNVQIFSFHDSNKIAWRYHQEFSNISQTFGNIFINRFKRT